jgi:hypothetical protein
LLTFIDASLGELLGRLKTSAPLAEVWEFYPPQRSIHLLRFICSGSIDRLALLMSVAKYSYETRLDVLHQPLEVIDIQEFPQTVDSQWLNQTFVK